MWDDREKEKFEEALKRIQQGKELRKKKGILADDAKWQKKQIYDLFGGLYKIRYKDLNDLYDRKKAKAEETKKWYLTTNCGQLGHLYVAEGIRHMMLPTSSSFWGETYSEQPVTVYKCAVCEKKAFSRRAPTEEEYEMPEIPEAYLALQEEAHKRYIGPIEQSIEEVRQEIDKINRACIDLCEAFGHDPVTEMDLVCPCCRKRVNKT